MGMRLQGVGRRAAAAVGGPWCTWGGELLLGCWDPPPSLCHLGVAYHIEKQYPKNRKPFLYLFFGLFFRPMKKNKKKKQEASTGCFCAVVVVCW